HIGRAKPHLSATLSALGRGWPRMTVRIETSGPVTTVILDRPEVRNAVDRPTAEALARAFAAFEADDTAKVAVLWGAGGTFCAGADLKAMADPDRRNNV